MATISTDRTVTPRAQRRAALCDQLMRAAETELDGGATMADLSVERLVQVAGISRSSFYKYFEDRGDVLQHWFASVLEEIVAATSNWWTLGPPVSHDDVRTVLAGIVHAYRPHARLMAATFDAATQDSALRAMTDGLISGSAADLRKHIRRGQEEGWIDSALPAEPTAAQLTWMAERTFHQLLPDASDSAVRRLIESYTTIVFKTLYVLPASR